MSIKKPKRVFNTKEEQSRYIEGFRTKYKTEMCKNYQLTGSCNFQDSCSFAHGPEELHNKLNMPKNYKTKQCKRFHEELYCPYGPRCQFKHSDDVSKNEYHNLSPSAAVTSLGSMIPDQTSSKLPSYDLEDMKLLHVALHQ